jgi:2-methylcitrate synthase
MGRVLDVSLILYAEHEFNASTFAARVTASTLTDLHGAITSAIATLKGPLHGGANEAVAKMLLEIKSRDRAERWVRDALASKRRVMGFGHRVLRQGDARSLIIQKHAETLSAACGDTRWYDIASIVDRIMREEKGLYPNLDYYTAVAYLLMGIPRDLYTPVFVCSRIAGWCAHVIEQQDHNRLIRPRAAYTGPGPRGYVTLEERGQPDSRRATTGREVRISLDVVCRPFSRPRAGSGACRPELFGLPGRRARHRAGVQL